MPLRNLNRRNKNAQRQRSISREPKKDPIENNITSTPEPTPEPIPESVPEPVTKKPLKHIINIKSSNSFNNNLKKGDKVETNNKEGIIVSTNRLGCNGILVRFNDNTKQVFFGKNQNNIIKI